MHVLYAVRCIKSTVCATTASIHAWLIVVVGVLLYDPKLYKQIGRDVRVQHDTKIL